MRYLADLLTLMRLILGVVLIGLAVGSGGMTAAEAAENAFLVFLVAELTDAFDGTCARRWPFPKGRVPKYRKYAALYDMVTDALLAGAQALFVTLKVNLAVGLTIFAFYVIICGGIEFLVYGKLFGHPDNCTKNSLVRRNFSVAKAIIMARRYVYAACLGVTNAVILFHTGWSTGVKAALFILGCVLYVFSWFFLQQRRENISRDAVGIERKLAKKGRKD